MEAFYDQGHTLVHEVLDADSLEEADLVLTRALIRVYYEGAHYALATMNAELDRPPDVTAVVHNEPGVDRGLI